MKPDEEINEILDILDILDALLDGIDPENYDDHAGPAGEWSRYGAQSTGSLRSPDCSSRTVFSVSTGSLDTFGASRFARTETRQQSPRRRAYFVHPSLRTHPTPGSVIKDD